MDDLRTAKLGLGGHTLCLVRNGEKLTHDGRGVSPMAELIASGRDLTGYSAADLVVGRAAAMLFVLAGIAAVYAVVISRGGLDYLKERGVTVEYGIVTDVIMNRLGTDRCPMEKAVEGITDPQKGYEAIVRTLAEMNK